MKKNKIKLLKRFFGLAFVFTLMLINDSCKKDHTIAGKTSLPFRHYEWSTKESLFFSTQIRHFQNGSGSRDETPVNYQPLLIQAYNKIADENELHSFVDDIVTSSGLPLWASSDIYEDPSTGKDIVIIPLMKEGTNEISGIISMYRGSGDFAIDGVKRQDVLDPNSMDVRLRLQYALAIYRLNKKIFSFHDAEMESKYCNYKQELDDVGFAPSTIQCNWEVMTLCEDTNDPSHYLFEQGGYIPIHLDHDQDGIPNAEDQDFLNSGVSQQDFTQIIQDYWEENYEGDYGDYEDFMNNGIDFNGGDDIDIDFEHIIDEIEQFIDDVERFVEGLLDFDDGPECPEWPFDNEISDREIFCQDFFVLVCTNSDDPWWEDITETVEAQDYGQFTSNEHRLCYSWAYNEVYNNLFLSCEDFYSAIDEYWADETNECSYLSPFFESCVADAFDAWLSDIIRVEGQAVEDIPITTNNLCCSALFTFNPITTASNTQRFGAGIRNFQVTFQLPGGLLRTYTVKNLYFEGAIPSVNCPTLAQQASSAVNTAVNNIQSQINQGTLPSTSCSECNPQEQLDYDVKSALIQTFHSAFVANSSPCTTNWSEVVFLSDGSAETKQASGAVFTDFIAQEAILCPN